MNVIEYCNKVLPFACYPETVTYSTGGVAGEPSPNVAYPALGLSNEYGELMEKRGTTNQHELISELGDVLWYFVAVCDEARIDVRDVLPTGKAPRANMDLFWHEAEELLSPISAVLGLVKKSIRDYGGNVAPLYDLLKLHLARVGSALCDACCAIHDSGLEGVMEDNYQKLHSLAMRGVIKGSGDAR